MTIKPEVLAAIKSIDRKLANHHAALREPYQILRAELLAMDARLADANALLSEIKKWDCDEAVRPFRASDAGVIFLLPEELRMKIQAHLSKPCP